jgi:hypothetical protein
MDKKMKRNSQGNFIKINHSNDLDLHNTKSSIASPAAVAVDFASNLHRCPTFCAITRVDVANIERTLHFAENIPRCNTYFKA